RGDDAEVLRLMLGDPRPEHDEPAVLEARQLYERGEYQKAINTWPRFAHAECKALNKLSKSGDVHEAVMSVDSSIRRIWVSALQSRLFNAVVAKRIGGLERLMDGDLAYKHDNGACFAVENTAFEQPRANAFDISPTGPLIGRRMAMPQGEALEIEKSVLDVYGVTPDQFRSSERDRSDGDRRPLRVRPDDLRLEGGVDEHGRYITFAFTLPPGSYATVLLREFMRNDDQALPPHEEVSTEE
ncbi:MAG TPA: tRNA pseudouridine(13) synthase TruD, partial [Tepidisphaeraceae bacterium]